MPWRASRPLTRFFSPCAQPGEPDVVAEQLAHFRKLPRRDERLREQIGAQPVRERARVDRVGLDPRRRDRHPFRACSNGLKWPSLA
jgi:hypothetical protein